MLLTYIIDYTRFKKMNFSVGMITIKVILSLIGAFIIKYVMS